MKKRNSHATRDALLSAARTEFQRSGYEAASTRKIAADAGCNVALINRYFGSKFGLFEAIMEACIDLSLLDGLTEDQLVSALVDIALAKTDGQNEFDPMVVAIKSSGSSVVQEVIRSRLGNPMVDQLAKYIDDENAKQKAGVLLSLISGIYVGRISIGAEGLASENDKTIRPILTAALQAVLTTRQR